MATLDGRVTDSQDNVATAPVLLTVLDEEVPGGTLLFDDDFDSGDLTHAHGSYNWGSSRGEEGARPAVSDDISHTGRYSLKFTFFGNASLSDDAWSEQRFNLGDQLTEIYLQWYQYFPDGTEGLGAKFEHRNATGPDNNKFLRLWDNDYNNYKLKLGFSTHNNKISPPTNAKIITEFGHNRKGVGTNGANQWKSAIVDANRGRWIQFRVHVKVATSADNDGVIEMWADGVKQIENTDLAMYPDGGVGNYLGRGYFMGWANSGFTNTTYSYIDEVVISSGGFI
ncbi:hypothetical protein LCGC14_3112400 [marine sediment metagenome]|uniref:Polysaccharide lyase n=1 Tax=marine sediment metagenome TaxID=412755 RepID=A0A0F8W4P7_9ZZZZ